jgi:hypothetical protein
LENWQTLLRRALACLASLDRTGLPRPGCTLGGGTALMLRYQHRRSRDIDLFLRDPQYLPALSPRLNDTTARLTDQYVEASHYLKLAFPEGEIVFIVAPALSDAPTATLAFEGTTLAMEAPVEIAAKKVFYRAAELKARDLFDLAVVLAGDPAAGGVLARLAAAKATQLVRRYPIVEREYTRRAAAEIDVLPAGRPMLADAPAIVGAWIASLPRA